MKMRTTMKAIRANYKKVFRCGYCDLSNIFYREEPDYYNSGVYGWNCDVYTSYGCSVPEYNIAITTGYRNMTGERIPSEIIKKYDDAAHKILRSDATWSLKSKALDNNLTAFFEELNNL